MTPFALVIRFSEPGEPATEIVTGLGQTVPSYCTEGTVSFSVPGAAGAVGVRAVVAGETTASGFLVDSGRHRLLVGDVRLDGRAALARRLSVSFPGASDLELVAAAVDSFGEEAPAHLVGQFSFVVWDWSQRVAWAARDHFGQRPLHVRRWADRVVLATDLGQLFAVGVGPGPQASDLDPGSIRSFLMEGRIDRRRTFFRSVQQVRPAHVLTLSATTSRQVRYWRVPAPAPKDIVYEDFLAEWRSLFADAVRDRLRTEFPIAAHLSGGLDSGSVVGAAHAVMRAEAALQRPFLLVSAKFPGMTCDETSQIDRVRETVPSFEFRSWDGRAGSFLDFDAPTLPAPGLHGAPGTQSWSDLTLAQSFGARVLLVGNGGDELGWAHGVLRDMLMRGRFVDLVQELSSFDGWPRRRRHFVQAVRGLVPLMGFVDRARAARLYQRTAWLGPRLRDPREAVRDETEDAEGEFASFTQQALWRTLTSPRAFSGLDARAILGARAGIEVRSPFLDVRLANHVLTIPWHFRYPRGDMRRLERDAVAPFLPEAVRNRRQKTLFTEARCNQIRLNLSRIQDLILGQEWFAAPFVDKAAAADLLKLSLAKDGQIRDPDTWRGLCRIATLEAWLRAVLAYHPPHEESGRRRAYALGGR